MRFYRIIAVSLWILLSLSIVLAHAEHAEPVVDKSSILYKIFLLHDWIHPVLFILMIYSCYYFRFFSARRINNEPKTCTGDCSNCYKEEGFLKKYHRYFFWGTFILLFVHIGEVIPSINNISSIDGIEFWILMSETSYLVAALFYLGTCYHFRYFAERLANKKLISYKLYNKLTSLNRHHNIFFWITISMVMLRFILMLIYTKSLIKTFPGTF